MTDSTAIAFVLAVAAFCGIIILAAAVYVAVRYRAPKEPKALEPRDPPRLADLLEGRRP